MPDIHLCLHCGEYCKGKYCSGCSTAFGRKKLTDAQEELKKERNAKINFPTKKSS